MGECGKPKARLVVTCARRIDARQSQGLHYREICKTVLGARRLDDSIHCFLVPTRFCNRNPPLCDIHEQIEIPS